MLKLNHHDVTPTIFPDGTSQVWKLPEAALDGDVAHVYWNFEGEPEVMHLAQLSALARHHFGTVELEIRTLPYARQDKPVGNAATFALLPFAGLLNAMRFDHVTIWDPHSRKALEAIERAEAMHFATETKRAFESFGADVVCYPDDGAVLKYTKIHPLPYVYADKRRCQTTGIIDTLTLHGKVRGLRVLIVDDICDGGATFIRLARNLINGGAKQVALFVSHGIFSRGIEPLKTAGISRIWTPEGER